jgi:hypothetical protein
MLVPLYCVAYEILLASWSQHAMTNIFAAQVFAGEMCRSFTDYESYQFELHILATSHLSQLASYLQYSISLS